MWSHLDKAWRAWLKPRPFSSLVLASWAKSLLVILGGLAFTFFLMGYWWPYYRIADMDMFVVYQGFRFNDHLPQDLFDHPGYLTDLLAGGWFHLLHSLGLLDVQALSDMPNGGSGAESAAGWIAAVRAGRMMSLLLAEGVILAFALLLRRLVGDWRVAALGTFAFAFSGGLATQARILRTELLSAGFASLALLILLIAADRPRLAWRPLLIGLAAFLMTAGMTNKVQAVFLIAVLPLLILAFGRQADEPPKLEPPGFWQDSRQAIIAAGAAWLIALITAIPAAPLVWTGLAQAPASLNVLRWHGLPVYQPLLIAWIVGCMIVFARLWRVPAYETLAGIAALLAGTALGLLLLDIRYDLGDVVAVINPLEHMAGFAAGDPHLAADHSMFGLGMLAALFGGVLKLLARMTYFLHSSPRPTIFLEWLVIAMAVAAFRAGERKLVLQVVLLLGAAFAVDMLGTLRGLKIEYFLYADPFVIIAAVLLLSRHRDFQLGRWVYQLGSLFIVLHVAFAMAEPIKSTFRTDVPLDFCVKHFHQTPQIEMLPFCPAGT